MKKNLKSKILLCVLAGGVLAANTVMAAEYTEQINPTNDSYGINIKTSDGNGNYTYEFGKNAALKVNGINHGAIYVEENTEDVKKIEIKDALDIIVNNKKYNENSRGIEVYDKDGIVIDRSGGGKITVLSENSETEQFEYVTGVDVVRGEENIILLGDAILNITSLNAQYGSQVVGIGIIDSIDSKVVMGNGSITTTALFNSAEDASVFENYGMQLTSNAKVEANNITVESYSQGNEKVPEMMVFGTYMEESKITVNDIKMNIIAEGKEAVGAYGLFSYESLVNYGNVDINTKTIGGSVENGQWIDSIAVYNMGGSTVNIAGGSITAQAYNSDGVTENKQALVRAIIGDDVSILNINQGTNNDVIINGDIETKTNATVNLNLNTEKSEFNGSVNDSSNNGTILNLANGAEWNNTGTSNLNTLSMDRGIVNQNIDKDIAIKNYSGTGNINFTAEDTDIDGVADFANVGKVTIDKAENGSFVTLGVVNNVINTLDVNKTEANLNALAEKISYNANDGNLNGKVIIKEGLITPEASGDLLFDTDDRGYVTNITGGDRTTETMYAMKNLAATAIVAWRQEDSTLSQRLGELRESADGQGIWVRMSRGEFEYDGEYKNQYNFFQMGYDWAADDWHYGAAISHNDGQTTYTYGDGENRSTSLSLYGTWLGDKGHYADIVLKQGRLSNDFDIYTNAGHTSGDYDAWGTSLSGEYGKKIALEDDWYVTPQAQLTLMRIGGEDYTTNNGINVHQDTLHSAVGRLGFELGKKIDDKGSVYAKASLLHDFAGNAETYLSYKGFANSYSQDISDTWCEAGIGFNYKTSDNSYVYADVVKTFGGDVEAPWQWNAGMRWSF